MAYTDTRRAAPSPGGLIGAMAITGGMLVTIATMAPEFVPILKPDRSRTIDPFTLPPPKPVEKTQERADDPTTSTQFTAPPRPPLPQPPQPGPPGGTLDPFPPLPPLPPGPGPTIDPPRLPVRTGASLDNRFRAALQPPYPPGMVRAEIEGSATVRVLIGTDGRVKAVEAVRADQDAFLEATRKQALARWRFLPAKLDGVPIESWKEMTVRFVMPD